MNPIIKNATIILLQIVVCLFLSAQLFVAYAADTTCSDTNPQACASSGFSVSTYLHADNQGGTTQEFAKKLQGGIGQAVVILINQLSYVIGSFAFLAIIIGGFTYLTSAGQERLITKAKDMVKYAIMGLVVALLAFYITAYVQSLFYG